MTHVRSDDSLPLGISQSNRRVGVCSVSVVRGKFVVRLEVLDLLIHRGEISKALLTD